MAPLNFDLRGYIFESGVDVLLSAYATASRALADNIGRIEAERDSYLASGAWIGEQDEDGHLVWEQEQLYAIDLEMAREALADLRKSFALAAYHLWERSARLWTNDHRSKHVELADKVRLAGINVHPDLEAIRNLANALKHNSKGAGEALAASWPSVLPRHQGAGFSGDLYGAVVLEEDHMSAIFNVIAASGPRKILSPAP